MYLCLIIFHAHVFVERLLLFSCRLFFRARILNNIILYWVISEKDLFFIIDEN